MSDATPHLTTTFLVNYYHDHPQPGMTDLIVGALLNDYRTARPALLSNGPWCRHQLWDATVFT